MTRDQLRQASDWRLLNHLIDPLDEKDNRAASEWHDQPVAAAWRARIISAQQCAELYRQGWPLRGAKRSKIVIPADEAH